MASNALEISQQPGMTNVPVVGQFDPSSQPRRVTPEVVSVSPKLVDAIIQQESSGRPGAVGKAGELGLMQITPGVAQRYGVKFGDLANPEINRQVGTRYLNDLLNMFNGNIMQALAAYNAGPARVRRGEIPESTRNYVRKILDSISSGIEGTAYAEEIPGGSSVALGSWHEAKEGGAPWDAPPPWETKAAPKAAVPDARTWYERNIKPLQGPVAKALAWWPAGTPDWIKQFGTPEMAQWLTKLAIPDTGKQAAIQAALLATGLGEVALPLRLAVPAAAGATVGALETGPGESRAVNAALGGGEGLLTSGLGEGGGALLGTAGRLAGKTRLLGKTAADVGAEIGQQLPNVVPHTTEELERLFTRKEAIAETEAATRPVRQAAAKAAAGTKFQIPRMVGKKVEIVEMSLPQAEKALADLSDLGFAKGGIKTQQAAKTARELAYRTRGQIAAKLNQLAPGMGDRWLAARRQMGVAQALTRVFKDGVPFNYETGEIDQPALMKQILKRWDDLVRNLGPDGATDLLRAVRRGDLSPVADVVGEKPHMGFRAHPGGAYPHVSPGRTYKPVGNVPWYMGRSASFQPWPSLAVAKAIQGLENQQ